jgi:hypothetical protein
MHDLYLEIARLPVNELSAAFGAILEVGKKKLGQAQ